MRPTYRYYIYNKRQTKRLVITPDGVCIQYEDGGVLDTNINPSNLFPGKTNLTKKQRKFIAKNAVEGYYYSPERIDRIRQEI
jgi:predicted DNA binding protein